MDKRNSAAYGWARAAAMRLKRFFARPDQHETDRKERDAAAKEAKPKEPK